MKKIFTISLSALFICASFVGAQNNDDRFKRCVLLEEFTTENCAICPHITKYVHQLMDDAEYQKKVVVVTHHSGNYEDFLTTQADRDLKWMYNENTYTPAFMFDRYPFFNTQNTSELTYTPVGLVNNLPLFKDYVDTRMSVNSHVGIELSAAFDDSQTLNVTVDCERDAECNINNPRVSVYLIENNIQAEHQKGVKDDYYHQYSLRDCNGTWGEEIVWDNNKYVYECSLIVDSKYKKEDLQIVAFVSNYNPDDPNDCVVENARVIPFENALGLNEVNAGEDIVRTQYYTTEGVPTTSGAGGVNIKKDTYSNGKVVVKKIVR